MLLWTKGRSVGVVSSHVTLMKERPMIMRVETASMRKTSSDPGMYDNSALFWQHTQLAASVAAQGKVELVKQRLLTSISN